MKEFILNIELGYCFFTQFINWYFSKAANYNGISIKIESSNGQVYTKGFVGLQNLIQPVTSPTTRKTFKTLSNSLR